MTKRGKHLFLRKIILIIYDALVTFGSTMISCLLTEGHFEFSSIWTYALVFTVITIITLAAFRLYDSLWEYASINEFVRLLLAILIVSLLNVSFIAITAILDFDIISISWCIVLFFLQFSFIALIRYSYRIIRYLKLERLKLRDNNNNNNNVKKVMIVGAGYTGLTILKEINNNHSLSMSVACLIDDDEAKKGQFMNGVKIVGGRDDIPEAASMYNVDTILIAMPIVPATELSKIIAICQDTHCHIQTLPPIYKVKEDKNYLSQMRDVQIQDLLGRDEIGSNIEEVNDYIKNKVVLVTGGGGSIGSELCRQIAKCEPKTLIILDFYENNAYDIEQELLQDYKNLDLVVLIANVCDEIKMDHVFEEYKPEIIFHAAAHKHVPLMETSPNEAIKNNVGGAIVLVKLAAKHNVKKVVQISTDKAVNPTNIMGASKRICEMIIQEANRLYENTDFVAVRFGNVLGSNGSVIPLFKKQIANGGPVTVTDKNITRFFMTIPEAVNLVLQAGTFAKGGEIFVLDMGQPVKIYDLAVNLIRLAGFTPGVDIKIEITGLRPGEKLYEELLMSEEGLKTTKNKLIHIGKPINFERETFISDVMSLINFANNEQNNEVKELVKKLVPTYVETKNR